MNEITQVRFISTDTSQIEIAFSDLSTVIQTHIVTNSEGIEVQIKGKYTEQLNEWLSEGNTILPYDPHYGWTPEQIQAEKIQQAEALVNAYIQAPITEYNNTTGVHFDGIHNCASYINSPNYTHYQFCVDVWAFNVAVWEASRQAQIDIATGTIPEPTTPEEFLALLPVFGE